ncbi:MAG: thioredoxin family protein [Verrucomicrobia bacterium]|nr:MAG: thioredoxin family protein [Verrucomicrobiota bacterium]
MHASSTGSFLRRGLLAAGFFAASLLSAATIGEPAPSFTLTDLNGTSHTLADFKGKTVVLEWVNPECPFVVKHYERSGNIPATQTMATSYGVVWLQINSAAAGKQGDFDTAQVKAWIEKNKVAATAYLRDTDGKVGRAYEARTTPQMFVINAEGILVYKGAIDDKPTANPKDVEGAENYVKTVLAAIKADQPIAKPSTQPYGCSVKY